MSTWLYQISPKLWSPEQYRFEVWERQDWAWPVGQKVTRGKVPAAGDTVVFFFSPTGGVDPGVYGWAVILAWLNDSDRELRFRPVAPSDYLKMDPWWDNNVSAIANRIRGNVKQGTLWPIAITDAKQLRAGISSWLGGRLARNIQA